MRDRARRTELVLAAAAEVRDRALRLVAEQRASGTLAGPQAPARPDRRMRSARA